MARRVWVSAGLLVFCALLAAAGTWVPAAIMGGTFLVLAVGMPVVFRGGWTKVDASGISYAWRGSGRARVIAWHEVGGIQVVEARTQTGGIVRTVKVVLRTGTRRSLPVLSDSTANPDPEFDRKVEAVRELASRYGVASGVPAVPVPGVPGVPGLNPVVPPPVVPPRVEAAWSRRDRRFRRWTWRYLTPVAALLLVLMGAMDIGPTWSAHLGGGTRGTFTVTSVECGRSCDWAGDFVSDDGTDTRVGVGLGSGGDVHHVGDRIRAVDTGDHINVYPAGGGHDWIATTLLTGFGAVLLVQWIRTVPLRSLRARRARKALSQD
ncbi:hypothetical protein [Streptacidiphilus jiangxiensis]|uniref:PH domain-containing protein n=1 Tax=Streptacidiphilus jiangxiensis TaxID=235985 RepID=A0A1H7VGU8_STRJI|nr:hypothetical protein [Streptacidiphilus jiangxiensis]SEM08492.1 hypothetical protein SAMN05414137_11836 [Streptacidiphilus jiangxiensis]